jgi:dipicolinate synthase subunit A
VVEFGAPRSDVAWGRITIAVVGGDQREQEIARLAAATGATVRAYGFPWPAEGIPGVALVSDPADAMRAANYALFPIPLGYDEGHLYAPHSPRPIDVNRELFAPLAAGSQIFLGRATSTLSRLAREAGVSLHEYDPDRELMLLRAPAIVEGALRLAIENTVVTIHDSNVVVVGYGNIGSLLVRRLTALGAHVYLAARNPVQRAGAYADGATPITLEQLTEVAPEVSMVFSTVPARVVGKEVLERLPRGSLVLDVAPPPDHADLELAARLGHRAVWARGLGNRAPVTVGRSQWMGLSRKIEALETEG